MKEHCCLQSACHDGSAFRGHAPRCRPLSCGSPHVKAGWTTQGDRGGGAGASSEWLAAELTNRRRAAAIFDWLRVRRNLPEASEFAGREEVQCSCVFAYSTMREISITTTGSFPTTQALWFGGSNATWPGPYSA